MLARSQYVAICQTCTNRGFDITKGVICRLTDEHAAFEGNECPNYALDEVARDKKAIADQLKKADEERQSTFGLSNFGIKSQTVAGLIISALCIIWLAVGLAYGYLFFYPILIGIVAIFLTAKGISNTIKKRKKEHRDANDILDDMI